MSADRLAEIKARAEDATPEDVPWLVEEVERLEAWKAEAIEVMTSLPELGKALGLPLGVQITGPAALAEVARLTAERDAFRKREECLSNEVEWWKERFPCDGLCSDAPEEDCSRHGRSAADLWRIISEVAAERDALAQVAREADALRAKVAAVQALHWDVEGKCAHCRDCYHDDYLSWPCPTAAAQADQA